MLVAFADVLVGLCVKGIRWREDMAYGMAHGDQQERVVAEDTQCHSGDEVVEGEMLLGAQRVQHHARPAMVEAG